MDRSSDDTPISPVTASKPGPQLTLSAASINNEPIELDSIEQELSPEVGRRQSEAVALESFHAKHGLDPEERKRRSELRAELGNQRKSDPAVMGHVPGDPSSTEFEETEAAEDDQQKASTGAKKA